MNTPTFVLLVVAFIAPIAWQRGHYAVKPKAFLKTNLRNWLGLNLHHAHWGILWILTASMWLMFGEKNIYAISLMGFGWGLLIDEIFPSLHMPSPGREIELNIYHGALKHTLLLAGAVILTLVILFLIFGKAG